MPVTPHPAVIAQALPDDYRLPSAMIERERALWLVSLRPEPRQRAACPEAKDGEIVVCAPREDDPARDRLGAPLPDPPTAAEELQRKMIVSIGPVTVQPAAGKGVAGEPVIGIKVGIKF